MPINFRVFENLIEGVQVISHEWKYIYINNTAVKQSKYGRQELLNHTPIELYPGIEKTDFFSVLQFVMNNRIAKSMVNRFEYPDKSIGYFNLNIEPIDEGVLILSVDITEQKLQEQKLQQTNQLLETQKQILAEQTEKLKKSLFEKTDMLKELQEQLGFVDALFQYSTEGLVLTNEKGEIIRINPNAEKMFGYEKNELLGQKVEVLIPQRFGNKHEHHRESFNKAPKPRPMGIGMNLFAKRKDNSEFPVEISLSPYTKNNEAFIIAFIIDISIRKKNEDDIKKKKEELQQLAENLKESNRLLEIHAESLSKSLDEKINLIKEIHHRVRNNLQVIISLIHLQSNQVKDKPLENVFRSFESKIETMAMVYNMTYTKGSLLTIDLKNFTEKFIEYILNKYKKTDIKFDFDLQVNNNFINIDTAISYGLLLNEILSNAIKFCPLQKKPCNLNLTLNEDGNHDFVLKISDNGNGIPKDVLANKNDFLGLFLIENLINQLDGNYQVNSTEQGTQYQIFFREIYH